jgi:hypothetical protein
MQLIRAIGSSALVLLLAQSTRVAHGRDGKANDRASASVSARGSARTSVYADSNDVTVVTPVATVEVAGPDATWSARAEYLADIVSAASVQARPWRRGDGAIDRVGSDSRAG